MKEVLSEKLKRKIPCSRPRQDDRIRYIEGLTKCIYIYTKHTYIFRWKDTGGKFKKLRMRWRGMCLAVLALNGL